MRLDLYLVSAGLAPSRTKAQELIKHGDVEVLHAGKWQIELSPAASTGESVRLRSQEILKYVSRGGLKLESALNRVPLSVAGKIVLDVGISTGGFTDCLLQRGAAKVVGIDVGSRQLAESLRSDRRIQAFENVNVRDLPSQTQILPLLADVDLCVIDVSFISLSLVLPTVAATLASHHLLALIKPQFELSAAALNKSGIVVDAADLKRATTRVHEAAAASGYQVLEVLACEWKGGDGNQEFFLFAKK